MSHQRYRTIVADPPWPYPEGFGYLGEGHDIKGRRRKPEERGPIYRRSLPYAAMSLEQIASLDVDALADDDCRLFLWATTRYLADAISLLPTWGFEYRQLIVWDKTPIFSPLPAHIAPNAAEFLIVATQGRPERVGTWPTSVVQARKPRAEHSRKPEVFLDLVEQVSPPPYLELFARRARFGWDYWGDESLGTAELPQEAA